MLTLFSRHGLFDVTVSAKGDIDVDYQPPREDVGICLGEAFRRALGDMRGSGATSRGGADDRGAGGGDGGRSRHAPHLVYKLPLGNEKVGTFDVELVEEFLRAFSQASGTCVH